VQSESDISPARITHIHGQFSLREAKVRDWQRELQVQMSKTRKGTRLLDETRSPKYKKEPPHSPSDKKVLAKSTGDTLPRTMQCALAQAMNTTRFAFASQSDRSLETVRPFQVHLTEISKPIFRHIGPGHYEGDDILERPSDSKNVIENKGFGSCRRNLLPHTPRKVTPFTAPERKHPKAVSKKVRQPKGRDLNRSMFATAYLKTSYHIPPPPAISKLL